MIKYFIPFCLFVSCSASENKSVEVTDLCEPNHVFTEQDSILLLLLNEEFDKEILFDQELEETDFVIGMRSIYYSATGQYVKSLKVLPDCLRIKYYNNWRAGQKLDYSLGYFQNFSIWLYSFLQEEYDLHHLRSIFYNLSLNSSGEGIMNEFDEIIPLFLDSDETNDLINESRILKLEVFNSLFDYLYIASQYRGNSDSLYFHVSRLINMTEFYNDFLIEKLVSYKLNSNDSLQQVVLNDLASMYETLNPQSCLFAKINYQHLFEDDIVSSCLECLEKGSKLDSIIAFGHYLNSLVDSRRLIEFEAKLNEHELNNKNIFKYPRVSNLEYGLVTDAKLKYFIVKGDTDSFWDLVVEIKPNPIVKVNRHGEGNQLAEYLDSRFTSLFGRDYNQEKLLPFVND